MKTLGVSQALLAALLFGASTPVVKLLLLVGFGGYGLSLAFFVMGLRHLGTARTGAYFGAAPFVGALTSVLLLDEAWGWRLLVAAALMAAGLWLHLTEEHIHEHAHEALEHDHEHTHDAHHQHTHVDGTDAGDTPHSHPHRHVPMVHSHTHTPDLHHRHGH